MNKKTLTALKASIQHWEDNVAATEPYQVAAGPSSCALCRLFHPWYSTSNKNDCKGCPVHTKTGSSFCIDTPHSATTRAIVSWCVSKAYWPAWQKAAQAELDFLKSLLPEQNDA